MFEAEEDMPWSAGVSFAQSKGNQIGDKQTWWMVIFAMDLRARSGNLQSLDLSFFAESQLTQTGVDFFAKQVVQGTF